MNRKIKTKEEARVIWDNLIFHMRTEDYQLGDSGDDRFDFIFLNTLIDIEFFIDSLKDDLRPPFMCYIEIRDEKKVETTAIGEQLLSINLEVILKSFQTENKPSNNKSLAGLDLEHALSPNCNLFYTQVKAFNNNASFEYHNGIKPSYSRAEYLNKFVESLRLQLKSSTFKKIVNIHNSHENQKIKSRKKYLNSLLKLDELTIISLYLCPNLMDRFRPIDAESYSRQLGIFLRRRKKDQPLHYLEGYLARWHYATRYGLYAHVLFIFDAKKVPDVQMLQNSILNDWSTFTKNKGRADLADFLKEDSDFKTSAISIKRENTKARKTLTQKVFPYFIKSDFYFKDPRILVKNRFSRGEIHTRAKKKAEPCDGSENSANSPIE